MGLILSLTSAAILINSITPLGALLTKDNQNSILLDGGQKYHPDITPYQWLVPTGGKKEILTFTNTVCLAYHVRMFWKFKDAPALHQSR